ncbi:class I SAM-dependent methyltransferase [Saccharothrix longispora]|uniref:class I SAM-dependent methyltransferase n=1 Tax=Saccharothrix longispora TaxID=33920 RepID=UPI0028FD3938|nr:class I SAM-dependent methyltransferase [Saccharothrix longispora]MDU0293545.1 class I SAM-dependent methyltransferase [Saccharothrix longispora]
MKVDLTGAPETMLATLYARALDARAARPVLGDTAALEAVGRIEYDFGRTGINAGTAAGVAMRAKLLDGWTRDFLAAHPSATVLHLACGLDTRARRVAFGEGVRWVDVELPEVAALRERLLPPPPGDYRLVHASVTSAGWLDEVPADRPVVVVAEGLTMYLTEEDVRGLVRRVVDRFTGGELLFDAYGSFGIRLQGFVPAVRRAGAVLRWGLDDPAVVEAWAPGLTCVDALRSVELPDIALMPASARVPLRVMARLPGFRDAGRVLRFRFQADRSGARPSDGA